MITRCFFPSNDGMFSHQVLVQRLVFLYDQRLFHSAYHRWVSRIWGTFAVSASRLMSQLSDPSKLSNLTWPPTCRRQKAATRRRRWGRGILVLQLAGWTLSSLICRYTWKYDLSNWSSNIFVCRVCKICHGFHIFVFLMICAWLLGDEEPNYSDHGVELWGPSYLTWNRTRYTD